MDPKALIDFADLARQFNWFKTQGPAKPDADFRNVIDMRFAAKLPRRTY